jgi:inner membrane protein involved in colicin E2 resistance
MPDWQNGSGAFFSQWHSNWLATNLSVIVERNNKLDTGLKFSNNGSILISFFKIGFSRAIFQ